MALMGPSGSGKSTLLRLLAGFAAPAAGTIRIRDREVAGPNRFLPPERRPIGFMHQSYALWPHLTVREHLQLPLRWRRVPPGDWAQRTSSLLEGLDLSGLEERYPASLSGGQQQRVALGRALAAEPEVLLLDEPLSNLDAGRKDHALEVLGRIRRSRTLSMVYVTHDPAEAMAVADRMAILWEGELVESGSPRDLYDRPQRAETASLLGYRNRLACIPLHREEDGKQAVGVSGGSGSLLSFTPHGEGDGPWECRFRPSDLRPGEGPPGSLTLPGRMQELLFRGAFWEGTVSTPAGTLRFSVPREAGTALHHTPPRKWHVSHGVLFPASREGARA